MGVNSDRFVEALSTDELMILDGAMGTELNRRGVETRLPLWSAIALIGEPEAVRRIHLDHIEAGAQIITTNTFRTSMRSLGKAGLAHRAGELTNLAAELAALARRAAAVNGTAAEDEVFIAGSIAPLEDCWRPELAPTGSEALKEHRLMARTLAAAGADLLLVETMGTLEEARAAVRAGVGTGLPVLVSFTLTPGLTLLDGTPLGEAVALTEDDGALAPLVNCIPAPAMDRAVEMLRSHTNRPFGAYANMGLPDDVEGWEAKGVLTPEEYAAHAKNWHETGARIIGGCCGTGPEHIKALAAALAG